MTTRALLFLALQATRSRALFQGSAAGDGALDGTGFASFPLTDVSWLTSPGLAVNLLGPSGNVLKTIPILAS